MSYLTTALLSLAGSTTAFTALAAGDGLRQGEQPFLQRLTPRSLVALLLLLLSCGAGVAGLHGATASRTLLDYLAVGLSFLGTGAILAAFLRGPALTGGETLAQRVTRWGWAGLGLLSLGQLLGLTGARTGQGQSLPAQPSIVGPALGVLGLVLVIAGVSAAAAAFRIRQPVATGSGPLFQRLHPLVRSAGIILALALAAVGLANLLTPGSGLFLSFVLLILGSGGALLSYRLDLQDEAERERGRWGISPRGWVSLGLLGLAGVALSADQAASWAGRSASLTDPAREREIQQMRALVARTEFELNQLRSNPAVSTPEARPGPSAEQLRLERDLADARSRLARLESAAREAPNRPTPSGTTTSDLSGYIPGRSASRRYGPGNTDTEPSGFSNDIPGRNRVRN
jgi:hypothetical protein